MDTTELDLGVTPPNKFVLVLPPIEPKESFGIGKDIGTKINLLGINTINELRSGGAKPYKTETDKENGGNLLRFRKGDHDVVVRTTRSGNRDVICGVTTHRKDEYGREVFHEIGIGDFPTFTAATKDKTTTSVYSLRGSSAEITDTHRLESKKGKSPHKFLQIAIKYGEGGTNFLKADALTVTVGDKTKGVERFTDMQRRGGVNLGETVRKIKNKPRTFEGVQVLNEEVLAGSVNFTYDRLKGSFIADTRSGVGRIVIGGVSLEDKLKSGYMSGQLRPSDHSERDSSEDLLGSRDLGTIRIPNSMIYQDSNWNLPQSVIK